MKKICIVLLLGVATLWACNHSDLKGDQVLAGTISLLNEIDENTDTILLSDNKLYIQYASAGTSSYLYSTNSDQNGKFIFTNLTQGQQYVIFSSVDSFGTSFTISGVFTAGNENISLTIVAPDNATNGLVIHAIDQKPSPAAFCNLYLFNSSVLAAQNDSAGSILRLQTDKYGNAFQYNLQAGTYYVKAYLTIGNTLLQADTSYTVAANKVTVANLLLDSANEFNLMIMDPNMMPVANCLVYIFNSRLIAENNTSEGSIYKLQTNLNGQVSIYDITPGIYYVNVHDVIGNLILGTKSPFQITVPSNSAGGQNIQLEILPN